jgi:hypothetical protein
MSLYLGLIYLIKAIVTIVNTQFHRKIIAHMQNKTQIRSETDRDPNNMRSTRKPDRQ